MHFFPNMSHQLCEEYQPPKIYAENQFRNILNLNQGEGLIKSSILFPTMVSYLLPLYEGDWGSAASDLWASISGFAVDWKPQ